MITEKRSRDSEKDIERIIDIGRKHKQLGLYLYLLYRGESRLEDLYRIYNYFSRHRVTLETVKLQLKYLTVKGLVRKEGETYRAIQVPAEALPGLFDFKRSRSGRLGSWKSLQFYLYNGELPTIRDINPKLVKKMREVIETAKDLVEKGRKEVALDLLIHTFLPVRQTGVLWLWHGDTFIFYEKKIMAGGSFHSVKFPTLSQLLKTLGFEEGVMIYHTLGVGETKKHLKRIFGEVNPWPYSRSIFYGLKKLGLIEEGYQHLVELQYINNKILFILKDISENVIQVFTLNWFNPPPPPLTQEGEKKVYLSMGVQHVKPSNEASYFSRFFM